MREDLDIIAANTLVGALATINEDGSPWNTPLHFAFGDDYVCWLSPENTQHSENIARDPRVNITLWTKEQIPDVKGAYISTTARRVEGLEEVAVRQVYAARLGGTIPEKFVSAATYKAPLGEINTTKTRGGRLYFDG